MVRGNDEAQLTKAALVLGAAKLLDGYRATTHWMALEALRGFGAEPVKERWVIDRNRATGGAVNRPGPAQVVAGVADESSRGVRCWGSGRA